MNKKRKNNFLKALNENKNVCFNISVFTEFLKDKDLMAILDPVTDVDILKLGLYGRVGTTKCYVSKRLPDNYIQFSDKENPDSRTSADWSTPISLDWGPRKLKRMMDLIAFW